MDLFEAIEARRKSLRHKPSKPLLLLDIDDTLIDCRYRKQRVFMDFAEQAHVRREFPLECRILAQVPLEKIRYRVDDCLKELGIENRTFGEHLLQFWQTRYFTYPYLVHDRAFPGAARFVSTCYGKGLGLVYLTGRDEPGMGQGTQEAMHSLGFPTQGQDIHFLLKPHPQIPDLSFKIEALETVARLGTVVAAFENELGNLNAMAQRFHDAAMYWRQTLFSPNQPEPHPRVEILTCFP